MSDLATDKYLSERDNLVAIARSIVNDHAVAEDLVQESWFRWIGASYPLDRSGPILKKIVANLCIDWHRRQARERKRDTEFLSASVNDHAPATEQLVMARQELRLVIQALSKQPKKNILALRLYCIDGLTYREIGAKLGVSHVSAFKMVAKALASAAAALET
ncbi:MAG: RNA polymerase sigma factor [Pseudomonadota bacterium]